MRGEALQHNVNDTTRVYVYADRSGTIAGYYTLSALSLKLKQLPAEHQAGRPGSWPVNANLLGKLAVDRRFKGNNLGDLLIQDAIDNTLTARKLVASAFLAIDAKPQSVGWYEKRDLGFLPMPNNRLLLPLNFIDLDLAKLEESIRKIPATADWETMETIRIELGPHDEP